MVNANFTLVISIILIIIFTSGCTSEQSPYFTADEIKKILENNSTVQINATYWSEDDVVKNIKEINEQCNNPMVAAPMYMATVNANGEIITLWIDTSDKKLLCKTNKILKIKSKDVDMKISLQQVFTELTANNTITEVHIFHEGGAELELDKTNLEIKEDNLIYNFIPASLNNQTFKKGDILTLRGFSLYLNENKIREAINNCIQQDIQQQPCADSSHVTFLSSGSDDVTYVIFKSSNGDEIAEAAFPEKKLYIEITKNSLSYSTGEVILTSATFRIEEKIISYNIGGENTDAFGHKYNLLNLTFENNKNVSLLVNLSDFEKLKMVANLEVNKTYKISYFADSHKLINISEE